VRAIGFAITWRDRPESAVTAYQTLNSWLTHLLRYDAAYNPGPVVDLPALVGWLWWAGAAVLLVVTVVILYLSRSTTDGDPDGLVPGLLPTALVVPLALILAPVAEDYHFVLALFPLLVVFRFMWDMYTCRYGDSGERQRTTFLVYTGLLLLSTVLLGAPWRFNVPDVEGWKSLSYYPRLYGALLLWALVMALLIRGRRSSALRTRHISEP
jgi:hypothetical protein